jgi:hypothetical protein
MVDEKMKDKANFDTSIPRRAAVAAVFRKGKPSYSADETSYLIDPKLHWGGGLPCSCTLLKWVFGMNADTECPID